MGDKLLVEFDAAGQEMRIMADYSQDPALLKIFNSKSPFDDVHSYTGSKIAGMTFENFLEAKAAGNKRVVGEHGLRHMGKFCNLSGLYRVGVKKQRINARVQYGIDKDYMTISSWQDTFHRAYPGIKRYWAAAIATAKDRGYAETRAGRRFYITDWNIPDRAWGCESSAINFPIQGTGADMKELAIAVISKKFPKFEFAWDLHDGEFGYIESKHINSNMQIIYDIRETLDNLPYKEAWGWEPTVPITWDAAVGKTWGDMKEVNWDEKGSLITTL